MLAKLHRTVDPRPEWLELALSGARFLRERCLLPGGRLPFSTTADGRAVYVQRKIYTECFYVLALAELSRATGESSLAARGRGGVRAGLVVGLRLDEGRAARPCPGETPKRSLAVPMILLNLIEELTDGDAEALLGRGGRVPPPRAPARAARRAARARDRGPGRRHHRLRRRPPPQPRPRDRGGLVPAVLGPAAGPRGPLARGDRRSCAGRSTAAGTSEHGGPLLLSRREGPLAAAARVEHEAVVAARRGPLRAPPRLLADPRRRRLGVVRDRRRVRRSRTSPTRSTASGTATSTAGARSRTASRAGPTRAASTCRARCGSAGGCCGRSRPRAEAMSDAVLLAIDLGGTKVAFAVVDADGAVLSRVEAAVARGRRGGELRRARRVRDRHRARGGPRLGRRARGRRRRARHLQPGDRPGLGPEPLGPRRGAARSASCARACRCRSSSTPTARATSSARRGGAPPAAAPTSSSSPWAPASAPASCPTAASSAAAAGSRAPSAGSPSTRAGARTTAAWARSRRRPPAPPSPGGSAPPRPRRWPRPPAAATPRPGARWTRPSSGSPWASPT